MEATITLDLDKLSPEALKILVDSGAIAAEQLEKLSLPVKQAESPSSRENRWITLDEAAEQYSLDRALLVRLAKEGHIPIWTDGESEIRLERREVARVAGKLDRNQWQELEGKPICLSEAERVYGFATSTLSAWARKGYIGVVERSSREVYLDEADVAYARALADFLGIRLGKALFPSSPQYAALK